MTPTTRGQDTTALLDRIVQRIVEAVDPEQIILFGSRAKGTAEDASDIDLCVIADMEESRRDVSRRIHGLFPHRHFSMDVIVRSPSEYDRERKLINSISYFIEKHGRVLYERTGQVKALKAKRRSQRAR